MREISIIERDVTQDELAQENAGFDEHAIDHGVAVQTSERFGYVAMDGERFIGCSSGLAYKNGDDFSGWFYLTDLFVEKAYRKRGLGAKLLAALEEKVRARGVTRIWTWTAGYEAPGFYKKQGYAVFAEMENWYSDGSSRVGLRKAL